MPKLKVEMKQALLFVHIHFIQVTDWGGPPLAGGKFQQGNFPSFERTIVREYSQGKFPEF
jgi:hypothetical protein